MFIVYSVTLSLGCETTSLMDAIHFIKQSSLSSYFGLFSLLLLTEAAKLKLPHGLGCYKGCKNLGPIISGKFKWLMIIVVLWLTYILRKDLELGHAETCGM